VFSAGNLSKVDGHSLKKWKSLTFKGKWIISFGLPINVNPSITLFLISGSGPIPQSPP